MKYINNLYCMLCDVYINPIYMNYTFVYKLYIDGKILFHYFLKDNGVN